MSYFSTPRRMLKPGRVRLVFFFVAAAAAIVTEFGRYVYRPYVRANSINDYGLADSIGNLGGIVVQIFVVLAVLNATRAQSYRLATLMAAGYVVYEFVQPSLPKGVIDWKDVAATLVGYGLSLLILESVWRRFRDAEPERER